MNLNDTIRLFGYGTSEGAEKGWDTRRGKAWDAKTQERDAKPEHELTSQEYYEKHRQRFDSLAGVPTRRSPANAVSYDRAIARAKRSAEEAWKQVREKAIGRVNAYGTSEGARKGWEVRPRAHITKRWADQWKPWIGVDLDGTLARHKSGSSRLEKVGDPIPKMLKRVKHWLSKGIEVRIFTARVASGQEAEFIKRTIKVIQDWTEKHTGHRLPVTAEKDPGMIGLYDDRAVRIIRNKGTIK